MMKNAIAGKSKKDGKCIMINDNYFNFYFFSCEYLGRIYGDNRLYSCSIFNSSRITVIVTRASKKGTKE